MRKFLAFVKPWNKDNRARAIVSLMSLEDSNLVGVTIGDSYHVEKEIASGGMGVVYRAKDLRLHRTVAIKVMHANVATDSRIMKRFSREAKATASMNHPNIVQVYDIGTYIDMPFFVMEMVEHPTLAAVIKKYGYGRGIPLDLFFKVARSMCKGLAFAHKQKFIHRDLKPANIFVAEDGRAIIADFGLVHVGNVTQLTKTGTFVGTPVYLSPEVASGGKATPQSDIYQMGVIMHEMLAGKRPFPGKYIHGISGKDFPDSYCRVSEKRPDVEPWLDEVIERCLSVKTKDRYDTMEELEKALEPQTVLIKSPSKNRNKTLLVALSLIFFLALAALYFSQSPRLTVNKLHIEKGVGSARLHVETTLPSRVMAICRQGEKQPYITEDKKLSRKHELTITNLSAGQEYNLETIVSGENNETTKGEAIKFFAEKPPKIGVDVAVIAGSAEATFTLPRSWNIKAEVVGPSNTIPAAIERSGTFVTCRAKVAPGKHHKLLLAFERGDWERFALPELSFVAPGKASQESALGLSLWNTICRPDLLNSAIPERTFSLLRKLGLGRINLMWRPTANIKALVQNAARARNVGMAVDVVLFINKMPSQRARFLQTLRKLIKECGLQVERYYLSAFIDGMGWYSSTSDYVKLLREVRQIVNEESSDTKVQLGSLGMIKDPSFADTLLRLAPSAFKTDGALAYSPCLSSDEWGAESRIGCYRSILSNRGCPIPPWTVFLGMPSNEPPFYDNPLSSLVLGDQKISNLGNPDLIFLPPAKQKALAEKDRATMINFFASADLGHSAIADEMTRETVRAFFHGAKSLHWVINPEDSFALYEWSEKKPSSYSSLIATLDLLLHQSKALSGHGKETSLAGFGIKSKKLHHLEWYVFSASKRQLVFLWPKNRGQKVQITIERSGTMVSLLGLESPKPIHRFLPLIDGRALLTADGPIVILSPKQ